MAKEFVIIAKYTVPANSPANSTVPIKFILDPRQGELNAIQVPKGETWVIKDIYVTKAPDVDGVVELFKNDDTKVLVTDPLSALVQSNPAKPKYKPIVFEEFSKLSADAITLDAAGTSNVDVTFYIKAEKYEAGAAAPAPAPQPQPARPGIADRIRRVIRGG